MKFLASNRQSHEDICFHDVLFHPDEQSINLFLQSFPKSPPKPDILGRICRRKALAFIQSKQYPKTLSAWTFLNYCCGGLRGGKALISWARPFWFIKVNAITLNPTQETTGNCCGLWHIVVKCSLPLISGIAHAVKFPPEIAASRMHCSCLISG